MKINIKTPKEQPLCTLKDGDCFEHMGNYYILTTERMKDAREIQCVNLETGDIEDFTFDAGVFKLDAIITLKRIGE